MAASPNAGSADSPSTVVVADEVWVLTREGLVSLDRDGLGRTGSVTVGAQACGLAATPGSIWVSDTDPFLHRVDAAERRVVETVGAEMGSCGDVRAAHGSLWASAADDDVVYRLDP